MSSSVSSNYKSVNGKSKAGLIGQLLNLIRSNTSRQTPHQSIGPTKANDLREDLSSGSGSPLLLANMQSSQTSMRNIQTNNQVNGLQGAQKGTTSYIQQKSPRALGPVGGNNNARHQAAAVHATLGLGSLFKQEKHELQLKAQQDLEDNTLTERSDNESPR